MSLVSIGRWKCVYGTKVGRWCEHNFPKLIMFLIDIAISLVSNDQFDTSKLIADDSMVTRANVIFRDRILEVMAIPGIAIDDRGRLGTDACE